jgi:hypothetical protein
MWTDLQEKACYEAFETIGAIAIPILSDRMFGQGYALKCQRIGSVWLISGHICLASDILHCLIPLVSPEDLDLIRCHHHHASVNDIRQHTNPIGLPVGKILRRMVVAIEQMDANIGHHVGPLDQC